MDIPMDSFFVSEIEKTRHIPERIASDTFMVSFPVIVRCFQNDLISLRLIIQVDGTHLLSLLSSVQPAS